MDSAVRRRPSPAFVLALIALFVALSGGAYAVSIGKNKVGSKQIKNGAVAGVDVKDDDLTGTDIDESSLTGLSATPSGAAGGALTGSYPNPSIASGAVGVAEHAVTPGARVTGAAVPVPDSTETVVPFDSESAPAGAFDNGNLHSNVTNNSRLTAPVTGIYWIHGQAQWQSDPDDDVVGRFLTIRGSDAVRSAVTEQTDNTVGEPAHQEISTVVRLQAGAFVELLAFQDNTDADSRAIQALGPNSPVFEMVWLAPSP